MKWNSMVKFVVLGLAVLLATSAFASNKGTLTLQEAVQVNGTQLPAGEYQVRWEGTGANVEVSFLQGKKEVAKASGKLVDLPKASGYDSSVVDHSGGTAALAEIRFANRKTALAIGGSATAESASK